MRARFYSPFTGRFETQDPLGVAGGSLDYYQYVDNEPVRASDPWDFRFTMSQTCRIRTEPQQERYDFYKDLGEQTTEFQKSLIEQGEFAPDTYSYIDENGDWAYGQIVYISYDQYEYDQENGFSELLPPNAILEVVYPDGSWPYCPTGPGSAGNPASPPAPPGGSHGGGGASGAAASHDPNTMLGPAGSGSSNFVTDTGVLPYQIEFENASSATAPAQSITITDQLDPNLNWSTFQLTDIRWGDTILSIPAGSQHYEATVPTTYNGQTFDVLVEAGIHTATGQVYATFQSIDPNTQLPPDVLAGFLPPENGTGRGMGDISFTIRAKRGPRDRHPDPQRGPITFDQNSPIATDQKMTKTQPGHRSNQQAAGDNRLRPALQQRQCPAADNHGEQLHHQHDRHRRRRRLGRRIVRTLRLNRRRAVRPRSSGHPRKPAQRNVHRLDHLRRLAGQYLCILQRGDRQRRQHRGRNRGAQATTTVPPQSTLTAVSGTGPYASTATLTATLVYGNSPVAGKLVTFSLVSADGTTSVGSATTNASGVATLSDVSLAGLSAGTDSGSVIASFAGDATYAATSASGNLVVNQATPTVPWVNPADTVAGTPLGSTQLDATASSQAPSPIYLTSGTVLGARPESDPDGDLHAHGHHRLHLGPTTATINVDQATPTVTWTNPADITYGTALWSTQLDATASVPGTSPIRPPRARS